MWETGRRFKRTALVVIDMQNAFFEEATLSAQRQKIVTRCNQLMAAARAGGTPIFNIKTVHKRDKSTWTLNMLDDDQGFLFEGTRQTHNLEGLNIQGSIEVIKRRDSSFWRTDLLQKLCEQEVDSLVLCGVSSHSCIAATASDAYAADLRVVLAKDAIASPSAEFEEGTLKILRQEYRQEAWSVAEIIEAMSCRGSDAAPAQFDE